jgi:hypothetical protein
MPALMPKPPPTSGAITRRRCSGKSSTSASSVRRRCGIWVEDQTVSSPVAGSKLASTPRFSIGTPV